jgi:hypothetical protein
VTLAPDQGGDDLSPDAYVMREPCRLCGSWLGKLKTKGGQDCIYCECGRHNYNAPKVETGRAVRRLSERPDIKPSRKWRILDTHGHRCVACGEHEKHLQIAHLISREDADRHGFLDEIIDSDLNLVPMCAECNSGQRPHGSVSVQLMYRCLLVSTKRDQP